MYFLRFNLLSSYFKYFDDKEIIETSDGIAFKISTIKLNIQGRPSPLNIGKTVLIRFPTLQDRFIDGDLLYIDQANSPKTSSEHPIVSNDHLDHTGRETYSVREDYLKAVSKTVEKALYSRIALIDKLIIDEIVELAPSKLAKVFLSSSQSKVQLYNNETGTPTLLGVTNRLLEETAKSLETRLSPRGSISFTINLGRESLFYIRSGNTTNNVLRNPKPKQQALLVTHGYVHDLAPDRARVLILASEMIEDKLVKTYESLDIKIPVTAELEGFRSVKVNGQPRYSATMDLDFYSKQFPEFKMTKRRFRKLQEDNK